jgi:hypothetical protein
MTPRFKGTPNFDLSQPCPLCGYRTQRLANVDLPLASYRNPRFTGTRRQRRLANRKPRYSWTGLLALCPAGIRHD